MPPTPPDQNGRQSSQNGDGGAGVPAPESLSDVLRDPGTVPTPGGPGRPPPHDPGGSVISLSLDSPGDDAPTVITPRAGGRPQPQPIPLLAGGEAPMVAGRRLGNYELIEAIGSGGMAAVLRARDLELGRIVALKILPPASARDAESVTRFKQEARAAALLDHENIARVYSCGEDQGLHFIAFEFVEGINLRVMIDRQGPIPVRDCIGYMIQVAAGLNHAAERGVVHRDIKPSNLVITPDGRVKIVDMGLARQLDNTPVNGGVTQSGVTLGTFDYISPEQALDPRRADVRSDIYSLGCAFYHALTCRPPVPEGTAAKKLHAHQHVDPLDPRQLNPQIPDEMVMVLARMMAKDPAKRYQTPTELIAHLKGLAEQMKLSPEAVGHDSVVQAVPAEVDSLQPPRLRLGLLFGISSVAIALVVLALSGGTSTHRTAATTWTSKNETPAEIEPNLGNPGTPAPGAVAEDRIVRTAEQFAAKLADPTTKRVEFAPGAEIDLTTLPEAVHFKGRELELSGSLSSPAHLRMNAVPLDAAAGSPRVGVLSLPSAAEVTISGVHFHIGRAARPDEPRGPGWVGLLLPEATRVTLGDCVFSASRGVGAVHVPRAKSRVRLDRCVFAASTFGLSMPDTGDVTATDCGFGPHDAAVQVGEPRGDAPVEGSPPAATVRLDRSSFLLGPDSAAVRTGQTAGAPAVRVVAGHCVFATVGAAGSFLSGSLGGRPVVVRSAGGGADVQYVGEAGRRNAYYGALPLAVTADGETRYLTFEECKAERFSAADPGAVQLVQRPWAELDPLTTLAGTHPWRAFQLKLTNAALFTTADEKVIGAQFHNPNVLPPRRAYPTIQWPPEVPKGSPSESRQLVWNPVAPPDEPLPKDTYRDLAFLLTNVRPGDVVLIRHNGPLPVEKTVDLEKPRNGSGELRLTFRPDKGFAPVLAAPGNEKLDQSLFRLVNGEITFEGVQFLLKPARPRNAQVVAAVTVIGGRACTFRDCLFTLAEEDDSCASAVQVADPDKVMAMDPGNRPEPALKFDRCVLRGKGRGVWVPVSRGVKVDFEQSLTALDGPLFFAETGGKPTPGARSGLRMNRVTCFVGGPVVNLRGGKVGEMRSSGLVPLEVHADECLFAAVPGAGQPIVELEGIDATEAKTVLEWKVQNANRYANFEDNAAVMVIRAGADGDPTKELSWDQWITFAGEKDGKPVGKVMFEKAPPGLHTLAEMRPADAGVRAVEFPDLTDPKPTDAGAKVETLPAPAREP